MTQAHKDTVFQRRKQVVPDGVGIFNPATAGTARNATITDLEGKQLIDFAGGIGVLNSGHCPAPVVEAIQQQASQLIHTCFHVATYDVYLDLCEKLAEIFPHGDHTKVMLTNTGAESVENAVKIARQATGRQGIICFSDAFHGRSMMAMSLTSKAAYKYNCGPFAPEVYRLPFPNHYRYGAGLDEATFIEQEIFKLKEAALNRFDPQSIAAVIIEPVQGEGGFTPVPPAYMNALREFCDAHGILLIIDEVQSGFCRTGKWAAYQHYDVIPDLSTWAKSMGAGMPIGCVIGKADIMDAAKPGTIGGTYLGNPVCAAASLANIRYMEEINLNQRAEQVGAAIRKRFERMQQRCPAVGDVRGLGAMLAFELVKDADPLQPDAELCHDLIHACLKRGLIVISAGTHKNVIRVLSPLTIEDELLEQGLDILEEELLRLHKGTPSIALT